MTAVPLRIEDLPHYTYEEYAQWEGKWEIINGIPYSMLPSPSKKHQRLVGKIIRQLDRSLVNCPNCEAFYSIDWFITNDTVVQPDALMVCDEKTDGDYVEETPDIIFEILSPSTSRK
ncbi:MAG: Uma2 family endonuclease, partial [bacterium]|nr:Uma2 family endonuclease [bacterium]